MIIQFAQATTMFELLCFNLWLSTQACVSLFDSDSFFNNSNMLSNCCSINIDKVQHQHLFRSIQSVTVSGKHANLFDACQNSICQSTFHWSRNIYFNKLNALVTGKHELLFAYDCWFMHAWVCLNETVSPNNNNHNNTNGCQCTFLSVFVSIYNCRVKHAWVCLILKVFPNNSNNNHCSINIVNCWFPIYLFNWCAINFTTSSLSFNDSRNTHRTKTINQLESRQQSFHENSERMFVVCNL